MWLFDTFIALIVFLALCLLAAIPLVRRHPLKEIHSPAEYGLLYENVSFSTRDHILLNGYWIPALGSQKTIIMLHGYAGSLDPDIRYAPHLHAAGFNVLMFDFRAHGRSPGIITSMGALERKDIKTAVDFVKAKGYFWIGLLGFSMGGRAAMLAAPQIPEVKALISDGGPARLVTALTQDLRLRKLPLPIAVPLAGMMLTGASLLSGINLFRIEPYYLAGKLKGIPILLINGEKDLYTNRREINRMLRDAGSQASLWSVAEAKHRNIEDTRAEEYLLRVTGFFNKHAGHIGNHGEHNETS